MDRIDFIETREDIVQNIKTLYSYLDGKVDNEHKDWAIQRMSQGKNYVIEVVDSQIPQIRNYAPNMIQTRK